MPMLLGTLGGSLLTGRALFWAGKGMYKTGNQGQGIKKKTLTPFRPPTDSEIIDYFKGVKGFNGVFSRNNLPKLKNGTYVINLDHSKEHTGL